MGERPTPRYPQSPALVLVPSEDRYKRKPLVPQPSLWELCSGWLRYQSIQVRWDIERWVARTLGRHWGAK